MCLGKIHKVFRKWEPFFDSFDKENKEGHKPKVRLRGTSLHFIISLDVVFAAFSATVYPVPDRVDVRIGICLLFPLLEQNARLHHSTEADKIDNKPGHVDTVPKSVSEIEE